jgi:hypothetical protein
MTDEKERDAAMPVELKNHLGLDWATRLGRPTQLLETTAFFKGLNTGWNASRKQAVEEFVRRVLKRWKSHHTERELAEEFRAVAKEMKDE